MTRITKTIWASALALALAGCGDDGSTDRGDTPGVDSGPGPMVDAFLPPGVDGGPRPDGFVPGVDSGTTPGVDGGGSTDPTSPNGTGPYSVSEESGSIDGATLVAYVPAVASGETVPLVLFKHGFQLATSNYATGLQQLASHGFVVVGVDTGGGLFGGPTNLEEQQATIAALEWAIGSAPFASTIDSSQIGVAGHSRGGKVATQVAAAESRIGATLLLDPVNGCGPGSSYSTDCPDVTSAAIAGSISEPIGVMGETNNASGGFMPCAPADQNYQTIYAALSAPPSWKAEWTFTGADHMDFTDDGGGFAGSACTDGPGDDEQIRQAWRAMMVAFFRQYLKGDAAMGDWLTGGSMPSGITVVSAP